MVCLCDNPHDHHEQQVPCDVLGRTQRQPRTLKPLGQTHLWDARARIGACGDWCTGHRVEEAFLSGLALALAVA